MAKRKAAESAVKPANETKRRTALLAWYDAHRRELPWRDTRDPYAIWVSEVMLQQTRVETVLRYYDAFMRRFPTPRDLADASEDDVMAAWSGLGYYRRARLLHRGVREVVATYAGQVPRDRDARHALPGIGRYTAGAIGSIAFDQREPIVDGNVARVLSRWYGIETPLGQAGTTRALWAHAERLADGSRPGALNQALMELGALVCTPRSPDCAGCPVRAGCTAASSGDPARLPVRARKAAPKRAQWVAIVAEPSPQAVWLTRGSAELFGGLWSLPMLEGSGRSAALRLKRAAGLSGRLDLVPCATVEHVLTHRHMVVALFRLRGPKARPAQDMRLVPYADLDQLGTSTLTRKLIGAFVRT